MNALLPRLFGDMSDWLDGDFPLRGGHPIRMEDKLTDNEYTLRAEMPGLDPEKDIQVTVDNGVLTVRAERREESRSTHRSEFRYGVLERSVRLPANVDDQRLAANYSKGILEVSVPLTSPESTGRQIPVRRTD
jgi:HSP20 family protein